MRGLAKATQEGSADQDRSCQICASCLTRGLEGYRRCAVRHLGSAAWGGNPTLPLPAAPSPGLGTARRSLACTPPADGQFHVLNRQERPLVKADTHNQDGGD